MAQPNLQIKVKSNIKKFTKGIRGWQKKQLPFAVAQTLTKTAFTLRKVAVDKIFPKAFKSANARNFATGILRVKPASKRHYESGRIFSSLFDSKELNYLMLHEEGGMKRPREGHAIAVPTRKTKGKLGKRRNKAWRPRQLLSKENYVKIEKPKGKMKYSIVRVAKAGKKTERIYNMVTSALISPKLKFANKAKGVVIRAMPKIFKRQFDYAVKTAKR